MESRVSQEYIISATLQHFAALDRRITGQALVTGKMSGRHTVVFHHLFDTWKERTHPDLPLSDKTSVHGT